MSEIDENKKLQRITKLLERGGTMLANHHECGAPLFRYQGKVLCPVCDFQDEQDKEQKKIQEIRQVIKIEKKPQVPEKVPVQKESAPEITTPKRPEGEYSQVVTLTKNKIQSIAQSLESETDLQRVKMKMECIELGLKILKSLES